MICINKQRAGGGQTAILGLLSNTYLASNVRVGRDPRSDSQTVDFESIELGGRSPTHMGLLVVCAGSPNAHNIAMAFTLDCNSRELFLFQVFSKHIFMPAN